MVLSHQPIRSHVLVGDGGELGVLGSGEGTSVVPGAGDGSVGGFPEVGSVAEPDRLRSPPVTGRATARVRHVGLHGDVCGTYEEGGGERQTHKNIRVYSLFFFGGG